MREGVLRPVLFWGFPLLAIAFLVYARPGLFRDPLTLGGLILIEIVLAGLWHYRKIYFPLMLITFMLAGVAFPLEGAALTARWLVLGAGAIAGAALWLRGRHQSLGALHFAAFSCVPAAAASAIESNDPTTSLLKVFSLFLLFLYCATGLRLAVSGREPQFAQGILLGCEINVWWCALDYPLGWSFWSNPNSLGAVVGVVFTPFLLWGLLIAETRNEKYRKVIGLLICLALLFVSMSRASILTAVATSVFLCFCLRRMRVLVHGAFMITLLLAVSAVIAPSKFEQLSKSLSSDVIYKGKKEQGVFGSRETPWQETVASLKLHPWFGTGFGTSDIGRKGQVAKISVLEGVYTNEGTNREHGNSYLALAEYLGILGGIPFVILILLVIRMIAHMARWMRRTSVAHHCAVPFSMILLGGLIHAFFEDWLLAVGYYLCFFFWVCAFVLDDMMPERTPFRFAAASPAHPHPNAPVPAMTSR